MPDYPIDGEQRISLSNRMSLLSTAMLRGTARMPEAAAAPEVLSVGQTPAAPPPFTLSLEAFVPAQPPCELDMAPPAVTPDVLGIPPAEQEAAEVAVIEFEPDPEEGAIYAMLHEIHTPDGMIYDVTLPQSGIPGAVLGPDQEVVRGNLRFPIHRIINGPERPTAPDQPGPDVLGAEEFITELPGIKHVLHLVKAPVETALVQAIEALEGPPQVLSAAGGEFATPLEGAEAWRSRFDPAKEHRVLLFIHGFNSSVPNTFRKEWVATYATGYDAVLGYNHPTFTRDPVQNAARLLEMIPDDVRLNVDIMAHSRGGLVTRSLVELQPLDAKLNVQRLITYGSPHAGTTLADEDHWERLISIGFTAISWLLSASGAGAALTLAPKGLEMLLRAGSQFLFDLPGVQAMDPDSDFLKQLNSPSEVAQRVRYAAVTSHFNPYTMAQRSFRQALTSMAAQVFLQAPNDLVVPTESMHSIDMSTALLPGDSVYKTDVNHFMYFEKPEVEQFTSTFLMS